MWGKHGQQNRLALFILGAILLFMVASIYADWLWFDSLSYLSVFKTFLFSQIFLGIAVGAFFAVFLYVNFRIAARGAKKLPKSPFHSIILGVSFIAGIFSSGAWFTVLRAQNAQPFGFVDPVFKNDIAFYVFTLPFYNFLVAVLFFALALGLALTAGTYLFSSQKKKFVNLSQDSEMPMSFEQGIQQISFNLSEKAKTHLAALGGLLLAVVGVFVWLKRYSILTSTRGAVHGAGFTDVTIMLPLYTIVAVLAIGTGVIALLYGYLKNTKLLVGGLGLTLVVLFGGMLIGGVVQALYVEPNEFNLEKPYLEQNIKHTLYAYDLNDVQTRDFPVTYNLTFQQIEENTETVDNIRLWDWRPLLETYRQIQLFRTYYDFLDVDIDRYEVDGKLRQMMVSPRELDQNQLDDAAKTWVNERLVFTHGYGVVVSPVNEVTSEGLPQLMVKDIPPQSSVDSLEVSQPGIYFGEKTDGWVVTNTDAQEFDYPLGSENVFTEYNGTDGIPLEGFFRKALFALKLRSLNLLVSSAVDADSTVLMKRNIQERVSSIAPFLQYDSDPYVVVDNGKLYWIIDAYTTTPGFPYSEQVGRANYIRNSIKIVLDAYDGSVNYYVVDEEDPLVKTYSKIFPDLFTPFAQMPEGLQDNIRYPEDIMRVQTQVYGTYHMKDPQVFYNREDVWRTPTEIYSSNKIDVRPYYVVLQLPGQEEEGFFLITPFIPRGKENMIGWLAAHSDPESYGKLEVFQLSKQELTYGPMQIEARIDQDTEISQLLTLWDQQGSEVVRGNLLVIPIEDSFLYIEPVYLRASGGGALPQLKRVIVAYDEQITMQESLQEALEVIFTDRANVIAPDGSLEQGQQPQQVFDLPQDKLSEASRLYDQAQSALQDGDFSTYAQRIEELGQLLNSE